MRDRWALGVVVATALLVAISSLGFNPSPRSALAQVPPTATPTPVVINTPTSTPPAPTSTSTTPATGVPPQPTDTPGAPPPVGGQPRPRGEPATPSLGIRVNACARVVGARGVSLGDAAGFGANHVQIVGRDDVVFVTAGPERADGVWWWKVTTQAGVVGWGINDDLLPHSGACFGLTAATFSPTPSPAARAAATATPGGKSGSLPSTGANTGGLVTAGVLIVILAVAGLIRRRNESAT